jgi:hypothetical protein
VTVEVLAGLAVIMAIAALLGGMAGGWMGRRRGSAGTEGLRNLPTLVDQSGKATREGIEALRGALTDAERVLGAKIEDGLRTGFDRLLAVLAEGAKTQTTQLETFRGDIVAVANAMTRLRAEVPAAFETAGAKAKADAADASKLLLTGLTAGLRQYGL